MRVTLRLNSEAAVAAEHLRQERHISLGEAVNELARAGLTQKRKPARFQQRTVGVGLRADATGIAGTLELLSQYDAKDA